MVFLGVLLIAVYRGALATQTLAGLLAIPFGISVVYAACNPPPRLRRLAGLAGSVCNPGEATMGFVLAVLGTGVLLSGLIRLRRTRIS